MNNPLTDITNPMSVYHSDDTTTATVVQESNEPIPMTKGESLFLLGFAIVAMASAILFVRWMNKVG